MLNFFKDYDKVHPVQTPPPAAAPKTGEELAGESIDDLKAYMESMKEGILAEVRDQISKITPSQKPDTSEQSDDIDTNDKEKEGGN